MALVTLKEGRYEIIEELGVGGFGKVFKVKDTMSSNVVRAVKRIEGGTLNSINSLNGEKTLKEVELLKKAKNNYIIKYMDYFSDSFFHYIVTELANDGDLAKRIARQKATGTNFSEDIVIFWSTQLLKGTQQK